MSYEISYIEETDWLGLSCEDCVSLIGWAIATYVAPKVLLSPEDAAAMAIAMATIVAWPDQRANLPGEFTLSLDTSEKFITVAMWFHARECGEIITLEVARVFANRMAEFVAKNARLRGH